CLDTTSKTMFIHSSWMSFLARSFVRIRSCVLSCNFFACHRLKVDKLVLHGSPVCQSPHNRASARHFCDRGVQLEHGSAVVRLREHAVDELHEDIRLVQVESAYDSRDVA